MLSRSQTSEYSASFAFFAPAACSREKQVKTTRRSPSSWQDLHINTSALVPHAAQGASGQPHAPRAAALPVPLPRAARLFP